MGWESHWSYQNNCKCSPESIEQQSRPRSASTTSALLMVLFSRSLDLGSIFTESKHYCVSIGERSRLQRQIARVWRTPALFRWWQQKEEGRRQMETGHLPNQVDYERHVSCALRWGYQADSFGKIHFRQLGRAPRTIQVSGSSALANRGNTGK